MNRIKYVSFLFRVIFQCVFGAVLLAQIIGWVIAPFANNLSHVIPNSYIAYVPNFISPDVRLQGFVISFASVLMELIAIFYLIKLFKHYEKQEIFTSEAVRCIRFAGYALLINQLLKPFVDFMLGFILTANNPPGFRFARIAINDGNIKMILIALVIILISWIMTEGCRLHEDQQLTI